MTTVILIIEYRLKTKNTIEFRAFVPRFDKNRKFFITYWGTDFDTDIGLNEEQKKRLLELLKRDFGYAPFSNNLKIDIDNNIYYEV